MQTAPLLRTTLAAALLALAPALARADEADGGVPPAPPAAPSASSPAPSASSPAPSASAPAPVIVPSCAEHVPPGATRPRLRESFPSRGTSGHATVLEVVVEHGRGETVLPQGFRVQTGSEAAKALADAGWELPDPAGAAAPEKTTGGDDAGDRATTIVRIPLLALPKEPGRHHLVLPPLPVAVARASGELLTVCTVPHEIVVDDPTASTPDAKPKDNPPARPQREEWTLAKWATIGGAIGALFAALAAWLLVRWMRRPRPVPPPPPPRPPWELAFEELHAVRHAGLVGQARFAEHFDRVSDAVRKYLGGRYGFDGLETTTDEMIAALRAVQPPLGDLAPILAFLGDCDLVKFARLTPSPEDCARILDLGEHIVRTTLPIPVAHAGGLVPPARPGGTP